MQNINYILNYNQIKHKPYEGFHENCLVLYEWDRYLWFVNDVYENAHNQKLYEILLRCAKYKENNVR